MNDIDLGQSLKQLRLPSFQKLYQEFAIHSEKNKDSYESYLMHLCEVELSVRHEKKLDRLLKVSNLNQTKTFDTFNQENISVNIRQKIKTLKDGDWVQKNENILAFGTPGSGKTHLVTALALEMINLGHSVFFSSCANLVQTLLKSKKDYDLSKKLKALRKYDILILDDIGYIQQNEEEMEVLFQVLADRYEQASIMITSNLPFSKWDQIFKNPMTTAAAVDRLVHHCVILEMNHESYRMKAAKKSKETEKGAPS